MSVSHILNTKGRSVVTAAPHDTVRSVAKALAEKRIGAIIVTNQNNVIQGIVSERDIVRCIATQGMDALEIPVSKIMTSKVKTCADEDSEIELMALMTENRIRHLPVVNNGKLGGMISIGDVVKFRIEAIFKPSAPITR
jgi:CBS domain-containing protein